MQKIVKFTDDKYICPQKAIRKFRSAKKLARSEEHTSELQSR